MLDLDSGIEDEWTAIFKRVRDLRSARDKSKLERSQARHRANLKELEPNTPLTYIGRMFDFFGKEMLLEKCNPKYVIVQVKGMKKGKPNDWTRWNIPYNDLQAKPLDERQITNRKIGIMAMGILGEISQA